MVDSVKKIAIIGHFAFGQQCYDGQTIKTQNLSSALKKYTKAELFEVDTYNWKKHPFRLLKNIKKAFKQCDFIIMLPAHNGLKIFAPLLAHFNNKYHKSIFYDVIGGWLPELLKEKKKLIKQLKSFNGIWVETTKMKTSLVEMGFKNIRLVSNFKELTPENPEDLTYSTQKPFRFCTFSRVCKLKGIEDAVNAIKALNEREKQVVATLDIYGQVDSNEIEWFENLKSTFTEAVQYKGTVDPNKSVEVLKDYFMLLFPTHFLTEGIPGTIIDAFAAGLPVISSKYENLADIFEEGKTGEVFNVGDEKALTEAISKSIKNQNMLEMKKNCVERSKAFLSAYVVGYIYELLIKG